MTKVPTSIEKSKKQRDNTKTLSAINAYILNINSYLIVKG